MTESVEFYDAATRRHMLLRDWGTPPEPWLFFKHADGQWVSQRKATLDDLAKLERLFGWPAKDES